MRAVTIAFFLFFLTLSVGLITNIEAQHFAETNQSIFGRSNTAIYNASQLDVADDAKFNDTINKFRTPGEQPGGLVDVFWAPFSLIYDVLSYLFNNFLMPIYDTGSYIQNLAGNDVKIISDDLASVITSAVRILMAFFIGQFLWKYNAKGGV